MCDKAHKLSCSLHTLRSHAPDDELRFDQGSVVGHGDWENFQRVSDGGFVMKKPGAAQFFDSCAA